MNASYFSVLRILADGAPHSEGQLRESTGLSRSAIRAAVRRIEILGLQVSDVRGPGYRLAAPLELLDSEALARRLDRVLPGFRVEEIEECPSTNSVLVERAAAGAAHGTILVCEHQSAGRGRRGNAWVAAIGGSLTFSILWRFRCGVAALAGLSLAAAVGAAHGLERQGIPGVSVKWPNDLYCGESKLGGILIETSGDAAGPCAAVIGIGINVRLPESARRLIGRPATDIASQVGAAPRRTELLAGLIESLAETLERFSNQGFAAFREEWLRRHAWQGRQVELSHDGRRLAGGKVVGVGEDGALMLASETGVERYQSGELSLRAG